MKNLILFFLLIYSGVLYSAPHCPLNTEPTYNYRSSYFTVKGNYDSLESACEHLVNAAVNYTSPYMENGFCWATQIKFNGTLIPGRKITFIVTKSCPSGYELDSAGFQCVMADTGDIQYLGIGDSPDPTNPTCFRCIEGHYNYALRRCEQVCIGDDLVVSPTTGACVISCPDGEVAFGPLHEEQCVPECSEGQHRTVVGVCEENNAGSSCDPNTAQCVDQCNGAAHVRSALCEYDNEGNQIQDCLCLTNTDVCGDQRYDCVVYCNEQHLTPSLDCNENHPSESVCNCLVDGDGGGGDTEGTLDFDYDRINDGTALPSYTCEQPPICDNSKLSCITAKQVWYAQCSTYNESQQAINSAQSISDTGGFNLGEEIDISQHILDITSFTVTAECSPPTFIDITLLGETHTLKISAQPYCDFATTIRPAILAIGMYMVILIVSRRI